MKIEVELKHIKKLLQIPDESLLPKAWVFQLEKNYSLFNKPGKQLPPFGVLMWRSIQSRLKLKLFLLIPLLIILGGLLSLGAIQDRFILQTRALPDDFSPSFHAPFEEVLLAPEKGVSKEPKGVILYFHGRGCNLSDPWEKVADRFTSEHYDFFIMDYRGFGKSRGRLSEKGLFKDGTVCYDYLHKRYPEKPILIYGRSLGTAIATHVAALQNPKALVLESPFYSFLDLATRYSPYLPRALLKALLKYPFETNLWIKSVKCPIYLIHGTEDELVAYDSSVRLKEALFEKKDAFLVPIQGGKHCKLYKDPDFQATLQELLQDGLKY